MNLNLETIREAIAPVEVVKLDTLEQALADWVTRNADAKAKAAALQEEIRQVLAGVTMPDLDRFEAAAKQRRMTAHDALCKALSQWGDDPANVAQHQMRAIMAAQQFSKIHDLNDLFGSRFPNSQYALAFIIAGKLDTPIVHLLPQRVEEWAPHLLYKLSEILECGAEHVAEMKAAKEEQDKISTFRVINLNQYAAVATTAQVAPLSLEDFTNVFGANAEQRHRNFHTNKSLHPDADVYKVGSAYEYQRALSKGMSS
jgi:hypothetical protein